MEPHRTFFRAKAMQKYLQRQETDIIPRFLSPYISVLFYILFFLLILTVLFAWWGKVPFSITGSGVVVTKVPAHTLRNNEMAIVLFLPAKYASQLHPGEDAELRVEPAGQQFTNAIRSIESKMISPDEARKRYMLNGSAAQVITQSSVVAILLPVAKSTHQLKTGDLVSAQVHIGSQSILSFCLGLQEAVKG